MTKHSALPHKDDKQIQMHTANVLSLSDPKHANKKTNEDQLNRRNFLKAALAAVQYCLNCGNNLPAGAKFCCKCGTAQI